MFIYHLLERFYNRKLWEPGERFVPENFSTGRRYTAGNSVYLMSRGIKQGFGDNRWGTYRQIEAAGGHVRKGEKGTQVLFWTQQKSRFITRQYTVFNVQQADGLSLPPLFGQPPSEWATHGEAERIIRGSGVLVQHVHGDRAYYRIAAYLEADRIELDQKPAPLFLAVDRWGLGLADQAMTAHGVRRMLKRQLKGAGLPEIICPHSFRVMEVTYLLAQNVPMEDVQYLAGHSNPSTTQLYDRRRRQVTRNIVECISV